MRTLCCVLAVALSYGSEPGWDLFWQDDLRDMNASIELNVNGSIPTWLDGSLIRNGPAQFTSPQNNVTFVYDGLAKLFKFGFQGGQVRYQERFLRTACFNSTREKGTFPKGPMMGALVPPLSPFSMPMSNFDNVNTQTWHLFGDDVGLATTDSAVIGMFDPNSLETRGTFNYPHKGLGDAILLSATHPHNVPGTGGKELVNVVTQLMGMGSHELKVYRMGADHKQVSFGKATVSFTPYIHSFGVTPGHMLLAVYPLSFKEMCVLEFKPLLDCLDWLGSNVTIFVFALNGTENAAPVMTVEAPPHFSMHHINSFEDGDAFVMDVSGYPDGAVFKSKYIHGDLDTMRDETDRNHVPNWAAYRRLRIDRSTGSVESTVVDLRDKHGFSYLIDFPFINPAYDAQKHCLMWAVTPYAENSTEYADWAIVRSDVCTSSEVNTLVWFKSGHYPSEPVFVPRPGATEEGDGVLLAQVLDGVNGTTYLLVLEPTTLEELATAYLPKGWATPYSQHGTWFPSSSREILV